MIENLHLVQRQDSNYMAMFFFNIIPKFAIIKFFNFCQNVKITSLN